MWYDIQFTAFVLFFSNFLYIYQLYMYLNKISAAPVAILPKREDLLDKCSLAQQLDSRHITRARENHIEITYHTKIHLVRPQVMRLCPNYQLRASEELLAAIGVVKVCVTAATVRSKQQWRT